MHHPNHPPFPSIPAGRPPHSSDVYAKGASPNQLVIDRESNSAGMWNGGRNQLTASGLVNPSARWHTPVFDLRPDLPVVSKGNNSRPQPIFRSENGNYGSLWVLVEGLNQNFGGGIGTAGLQVTYQILASPLGADLVRRVSNRVNITGEFFVDTSLPPADQKQGTVLKFNPLTTVDPIRYWQVEILFNWTFTFTSVPRLSFQANYY